MTSETLRVVKSPHTMTPAGPVRYKLAPVPTRRRCAVCHGFLSEEPDQVEEFDKELVPAILTWPPINMRQEYEHRIRQTRKCRLCGEWNQEEKVDDR
ncbi:MAG: hypothetical protein ACUVX1_14420 [Chloroflexota bacterium]